MPTKFRFMRNANGQLTVSSGWQSDESDSDAEMCLAYAGDSEEEERVVVGAALHLSQDASFESLMRSGPGALTGIRRYLDPGKPIYLYWQFIAACKSKDEPGASYSSFLRVFHLVFGRIGFLKFRKKQGDHAKCTACEGYKEELRNARNISQRELVMTDTRRKKPHSLPIVCRCVHIGAGIVASVMPHRAFAMVV